MTEKELIDKYTIHRVKWAELCCEEELSEDFIEKY